MSSGAEAERKDPMIDHITSSSSSSIKSHPIIINHRSHHHRRQTPPSDDHPLHQELLQYCGTIQYRSVP
eukprot:scaffold35911_cov199-Amphora_coffeaeformis.AAC.2